MEQPKITNTKQARDFYKRYVHGCPRGCDLYEAFTPETLKAYEEHSSDELELQWCFEEFEKYFSQITSKNPGNHKLLKSAWEWHNECTPIRTVAEKLETMMNDCNGKPDKTLLKCVISAALETDINKSDEEEEKLLMRLMELCEPYVNGEERDQLRLKITGPVSEAEAKHQYMLNRFSYDPDSISDDFQTNAAEQNFRRFATPENMLKWKQEYFDEWTGKEYFFSKENMQCVSVIELGARNYGIYSRKNLQKLFDKLSDYKNCAAEDQYWHIAYELVSNLSKRLFEDEEYDMLEKFFQLAVKMLCDAPDCWSREYFGSHALDIIDQYRDLMDEKMFDILRGTERDIEPWTELVRSMRDNFPGLETDAGMDDYRNTVLEFMKENRALCAKDSGRIVGVLLYSVTHNMICCLAVSPEYRRNGIASALITEALEWLDHSRDITVTTFREDDPRGAAPRALYKKFGFVEGKLVTEFDCPSQMLVLPPSA